MSDGPHRSLPMRSHWKDVAQRAAQAAFSPEQVCEALPYALKRDILEAPIKAVRDIMNGDSLFPQLRIEQLEGLRDSCRGSAQGNALVDCAVEAVRDGLTGDAATEMALRNTLEDGTRCAVRSIEEHYEREASSCSAGFLRERLDAARQKLDCAAVARELLSPERPPAKRSITLPRRTGVDEGPTL